MKSIKIKKVINENLKLNENNNKDKINKNFKWNEIKNNKDNVKDKEDEVIFNEVHVLSRIKLSRLKSLFIF